MWSAAAILDLRIGRAALPTLTAAGPAGLHRPGGLPGGSRTAPSPPRTAAAGVVTEAVGIAAGA